MSEPAGRRRGRRRASRSETRGRRIRAAVSASNRALADGSSRRDRTSSTGRPARPLLLAPPRPGRDDAPRRHDRSHPPSARLRPMTGRGTSGSTRRPSAISSFDLTTSTRRIPALGVGSAPADRERPRRRPAERVRPRTTCEAAGPVAACAPTGEHLAHLAAQPLLARAYERLNLDQLHRADVGAAARGGIEHAAAAPASAPATARSPGSPTADGGAPPRRGAAADHPAGPRRVRALAEALDEYLQTLRPQWRRVRRRLHAGRRRAQGRRRRPVGLRAYIALCEGWSPDDALFLQLKQARRSVVAHTCTAAPRGTPTRGSGSSSTSRRCRRSATRCSAGPRSASGSTTCASSAT